MGTPPGCLETLGWDSDAMRGRVVVPECLRWIQLSFDFQVNLSAGNRAKKMFIIYSYEEGCQVAIRMSRCAVDPSTNQVLLYSAGLA